MAKKRFIVDAMLGKLARYLRILGYDTIYVQSLADSEIISVCLSSNRIVVTRDKELCYRAWKNGCECIYMSRPYKITVMLSYISYLLGIRLEFDPNNTRCPLCNNRLVKLAPEEIKSTGLKNYTMVYRCPSCNNLYWNGSHWLNISKNIEEAKKCLRMLSTPAN